MQTKHISTYQMVGPWCSRPVATISTNTAISSKYLKITVISVSTNLNSISRTDKSYLCRAGRQITLFTYSQVAVMISSQEALPMAIEVHPNVVERLCSRRSIVDIFSSKTFYV